MIELPLVAEFEPGYPFGDDLDLLLPVTLTTGINKRVSTARDDFESSVCFSIRMLVTELGLNGLWDDDEEK